ncbi:MAG: DUF1217 domain-containing protein [Proteobacteria bacterium]|nr:DUF1217 domain-containing protein [Pseudomonadota bacterium]
MSGVDPAASEAAYLFATMGSGSGGLLNTLYGITGGGAASFQNPAVALDTAEQNQTKDVAMTAAEPQVQRAVAAFTQGVQSATSVQQLLSNPQVMNVLLTANGLADQIPYTALAQKALMSDPSDPNSLVNKLSDTRWKTTAQTYQFATAGLSVIQSPSTISTIANAYAEVTWRTSLDATTPGLSNALTFRASAATITSVDQILGDPILRNVVTTALGIPVQIAFQDLNAQEKAISSRLDITQFQDPHFVEAFAQRYLIAAGGQQQTSSTMPSMDALATQAQGLVV